MPSPPASIYHGTLPLILEGEDITDSPNGTLDAINFDIAVGTDDTWRVLLAEAGIIKGRKLAGLAAASFDYHAIFVSNFRVRERSDAKVIVSVSTLGLLEEDEKRKTTISCQGGRATIGPQEIKDAALRDMDGNLVKMDLSGWIFNNATGTLVPREMFPSRLFTDPPTQASAWSIAVPKISLTSTYFTTIRPDQTLVGTVVTPPLDVDPPAFPFSETDWEGLRQRLNDPAGWVLDQRTIEELFVDGTMPDGPHFIPPPTTEPVNRGLWAVTDIVTYFMPWEPTS